MQAHTHPLRAADSKMFQLSDELGRPLFENIQISLVCSECLKTDEPEKCTHKMAEMPRWLSSSKMEIVKSILSDDPAMLYATILKRRPAVPETRP